MTLLTVIVFLLIAIRLMTYRRRGATHKPWANWLAYGVTLMCASVPIRAAFGLLPPMDSPALMAAILLLLALLRSRGNILALLPDFSTTRQRIRQLFCFLRGGKYGSY